MTIILLLAFLTSVMSMVDLSVYAFTASAGTTKKVSSDSASDNGYSVQLVPSQLYAGRGETIPNVRMSEKGKATNVTSKGSTTTTKGNNATNEQRIDNNSKKQRRRRNKKNRFGNLPDVQWRSITMEHLRLHPHFDALPEHVRKIDQLEDVRYFRQDSWQWDALHSGRCTTSQASAALGFLNPEAAKVLNIPRSWQRGGLGAYHRLCEQALRSLEDMQLQLIEEAPPSSNGQGSNRSRKKEQRKIWFQQPATTSTTSSAPQRGRSYPFAAIYKVRMTMEERQKRQERLLHGNAASSGMTKMSWGNAQEATAVLTALNYFYKSDPGVRVKEVGMCGAGISEDLLIGASPDALLHHSDGTVEVLEVKNHCPFYATRKWGDHNQNKDFEIKSFPFSKPYIQPQYMPQVMMEMYCVGPHCSSSVMVRQTAIDGALIVRIQRNNEWIDEMLFWLRRFQSDFVTKQIPPHQNFFWDDERYRRFVNHTRELAEKVEVVEHVPHKDIQRMVGKGPNVTSLFLD